ncbi:MAG: DUF2480 family protein [Rhodothermales bacterium]|nr:DUF2480 family protein [Rhodothermales bacterium]
MEPIVNKVADSEIEVLNLEELWDGRPVRELDISEFLIEGLVLREKAFRALVKEYDWKSFEGAHVAIGCTTDAIVPTWAYMLIASRLEGMAASTAVGKRIDLIRDQFTRTLDSLDWSRYQDAIVVVKGCGSETVPENAYLLAARELKQVARKVMYGEPCSSVPIWRRPADSFSKAEGAVAGSVAAKLPSKSR